VTAVEILFVFLFNVVLNCCKRLFVFVSNAVSTQCKNKKIGADGTTAACAREAISLQKKINFAKDDTFFAFFVKMSP